jgi:hypothetical protein
MRKDTNTRGKSDSGRYPKSQLSIYVKPYFSSLLFIPRLCCSLLVKPPSFDVKCFYVWRWRDSSPKTYPKLRANQNSREAALGTYKIPPNYSLSLIGNRKTHWPAESMLQEQTAF